MSIWAQITEDDYVIRVIDDVSMNENEIQEFLSTGTWVDVTNSQNSLGFLELGRIYDRDTNSVLVSSVYPSWIFNQDTLVWEAPIPQPEDGEEYVWNEQAVSWDLA